VIVLYYTIYNILLFVYKLRPYVTANDLDSLPIWTKQ